MRIWLLFSVIISCSSALAVSPSPTPSSCPTPSPSVAPTVFTNPADVSVSVNITSIGPAVSYSAANPNVPMAGWPSYLGTPPSFLINGYGNTSCGTQVYQNQQFAITVYNSSSAQAAMFDKMYDTSLQALSLIAAGKQMVFTINGMGICNAPPPNMPGGVFVSLDGALTYVGFTLTNP